jgi:phage gp36-like protein
MAYCTVQDLIRGINASAIASLSVSDKQWAIDVGAALMDGYFRARYGAPLTTWGMDSTLCNVRLALWQLMTQRGFRPEAGADETIRLGYEDAIAWLKGVARQEVHPIAAPQPAAPDGGQAWITSAPNRCIGGRVR